MVLYALKTYINTMAIFETYIIYALPTEFSKKYVAYSVEIRLVIFILTS